MDDFIFGSLSTEQQRRDRDLQSRASVAHLQRRSPRDPMPGQPVEVMLTVGPTIPSQRAFVYWSIDDEDPDGKLGEAFHGFVLPLKPAGSTWDTLVWGYIQQYHGAIPAQPAGVVVRYRLSSVSPTGEETFADDGTYYAYYVDNDPLPDWTRDAIVYQIFPDRFNPGGGKPWNPSGNLNGFLGGTLRGVIEKLDYLADLGFNTLYLNPVFPSPSYHGYDSTDVFSIEPRYGTMEDFDELVQGAHARGMRVLLDLVPNHWSNRHPSFVDAQQNPDSLYRRWYNWRSWPHDYEDFFGVKYMPKLHLRNREPRKYFLDMVEFWLRKGVDGYRVDYAIGPVPDFWADFRRATRRARQDSWTFGESVDTPEVLLGFSGQMDGSLDFTLLEALRETFGFGRWSAIKFASFLDRHEAFFPEDYSRPSFLDNHDMNRFLWLARNDKRRLRLAALCQFTLVGPPVVYYGTEAGLSQNKDLRDGGRMRHQEARLPMIWGPEQDQDLIAYFTALIALRKGSHALRRGSRKTLHVDDDVLIYSREAGDETLLVALNLSERAREIVVPGGPVSIVFGTQMPSLESTGGLQRLSLPALGGAVMAPWRNV